MTATVPTAKSRPVPTVGRRPLLAGATGAAALAGCAPATAPLTLAPAGPGTLATAGGGTAAANAALQTVRVTIEVNKAALVGQLHAYLSDPHFSINRHPVVDDWSSAKKLNLSRALLEALLLEGDLEPHDVEQFVDGLLSGYENMVVR